MANSSNAPHTYGRFAFLDSTRGLMALWVAAGHLGNATGYSHWLIRAHPIGVDVFIILSGFLMTYHYLQRESLDPWDSPRSWRRFWVRRYFRIAPAYYFSFAVACVFMGSYLRFQHTLAATFHHPWMLDPTSPESHVAWRTDWTCIFLHLSFLFGFVPSEGFTSPLPDWSLGLEAQFYLAFPFLMLLWRRFNWVGIVSLSLGFAVATYKLFGLNQTHGWLSISYLMPTFLGFRILMFLCGMLLAEAFARSQAGKSNNAALLVVLSSGLCAWSNNHLLLGVYGVIVLCVFANTDDSRVGLMLSRALSRPAFVFLGDISYPVYLCHQLVLLPICALLASTDWFRGDSPTLRWGISAAIVFPLLLVFAYLIHIWVENPGIKLGRRIAERV